MKPNRWLSTARVVLIGAFAYAFWLPWKMALPEDDMWWMFPTLAQAVEGKSPWDLLGYLLGPWPVSFGQPVLKVYLYTGMALFGAQVKPLIAAALLLHGLSAVLLYRVCRLLRLSGRIALLASLIHLTAFAHFHAFFFPSNFRHVFAVFTILLLFQFYLWAEQRMRLGESPYTVGAFWGALAVGGLASVQRSAAIALVIVLAHICLAPASRDERLSRYHRWLPLFVVWMLYPTFMVAFVGDVIVNDVVARMAYPPALKWAALLTLGGAGLVALHFGIRRFGTGIWTRRLFFLSGVGIGGALWGSLALRDTRQLLLPYNALAPFWTALAVLFDPLTAAMRMDATQPHHYLLAWFPVWSLLFLVLLLWIFWAGFLRHKPQLWVWGVWYAVTLIHLLRHYSNSPPTIPSRFFLYVTPVLAVILSCGVVWMATRWFRRTLVRWVDRDVLLAGGLVALALPNLAAVPVGQLRGKLVNTYLMVDDLRTAGLIQKDLAASEVLPTVRPEEILVRGVVEMPHGAMASDHTLADPLRYTNFRWTFGQALRDPSMHRVRVNLPEEASLKKIYTIQETRVVDREGRSIDPFDRWLALGFEHLEAGRRGEALDSFRQALRTRPFFLQYLLGSLEMSDLRWITGGEGLRSWVRRIADLHARTGIQPHRKTEQIRAIMEREIWDEITGLFLVSYLLEEEQAGKGERWLAQIRFLEPDAQTLVWRLAEHPWIRSHPEVGSHLKLLQDPRVFQEPIPWRKDDYGFERFLLRLLSGWNIRSGWERVPEMVL